MASVTFVGLPFKSAVSDLRKMEFGKLLGRSGKRKIRKNLWRNVQIMATAFPRRRISAERGKCQKFWDSRIFRNQ